MADVDVIAQTCSEFESKLVELTCLTEVLEDLAGETSPPPWVFVLACRVRALNEASDVFTTAVYEHAMPHLRDLAALNKPKAQQAAH